MSEFKPTDEQESIRQVAARASGSLMVKAYAGCTKTTTLEIVGKEIKVPAIALAFNVSIKNEMARRFGPNFKVQTMNGLGFGALTRALPGISFAPPEPRKTSKLITAVAKDNDISLLEEQWILARDLLQAAMQAGIVPRDEGRPLLDDTPYNWESLAQNVGILPDDMPFFINIAYQALERNNQLVREGKISFDDQVYYSTCVAGNFPQYPVMLVDEAQDLSPLNHAMLALSSRPGGRTVAVGDPKQAIYAFRGADSRSMAKLRELRSHNEWEDRPLTLTFRCPKLVVERQQEHAPGFRAAEANLPGHYSQVGKEDEFGEASWSWADVASKVGGRSLAVLCRNNAPLLSLAFKLLRQRVSVKMLGRDIGTGLIALSRKLFPEDGTGRDSMLGDLAGWEESETSQAIVMDKLESVDLIRDKAESLRAVISYGEVEDAGRLRAALKALFENSDGQVTLATIHRSKGLEWDAVLHLDPWRIPSKWAKEAARYGDTVQLEQEWNLLYVCETRTKDLLLEANIKEMI